jgi:thiamine-phosphate pyrophosphorylase
VTPDISETAVLLAKVGDAIAGGARLIQYRNKTAPHALLLEQAKALAVLCSSRGAALVINDHVDIAHAADADGVHLGGDDGTAGAARAVLGPAKLIGVSCYASIERARAAAKDGADYVAFGSFFPSRVKPGAVRASIELLTEAARELALPIVAIGGITRDNARALVSAGADAVAVISAVFDTTDVCAAASAFAPIFEGAT